MTKTGTKIPKEEYLTTGKNIIIDQGKDSIAGYTDRQKGIFKEVPVIVFGDHTRIVKYVDKPFFLGADGVKVLKSKEKESNYKYLYYALKAAHIPNTGYNRHFKWLKQININYQDFNEQKNIVDILDSLTRVIKVRQKELAFFDKLIKARFVEMFGTIENNIFNYQVVELGKYVSIQGGYAFKSKDFTNSGIRLVQISNVNKDFLEWNNINWLPTSFEQKYKEYLLNENDLVIAMTRPIIKSLNSVKIAKVSKSDLPSLLNQRVGRFIFNKNYVNPIFLEVLCKLQNFKYYIEKMSGNSLQPNVSGKQIEKYKIILPPLPLQNEFADFVQQVDKSKVAVQKSLDETQKLFDSLMQEYFG